MKNITSLLTVLLLSTIIACGGGGGDSPPEPPVNQAPNAVAPSDFVAVEATQVTLNGIDSNDSDGSITSYLWTQTLGSPTVTLTDANSVSAAFSAPDVDNDVQLTFELMVTDNDGETNTDTVIVTIKPDQAPSAVAPSDFQAVETTTVNLDGSTSSDDVSIASYLWAQTAGQMVTLNSESTAIASFTAPEVAENQMLEMTFSLTVTDSIGQVTIDTVNVIIIDTPAILTISGKITYDHVLHSEASALDYNNIERSNMRGATVELLDASGSSILDTTASDSSGDYSFVVSTNTDYIVRTKAELKQQGSLPSWDFTVVDNTSGQALYAMDSAVQSVTVAPVTLDLNAASGWTGSDYTEARVAAPFAILDSIYEAKEKVVAADASAAMPSLKLNWSVNNVAVDGNTSLGQISTSHFNGTEIFILGDANSDTDEYDGHVIVHEWGHYFEGQLSRSDSVGGAHGSGDKLDMRVALGEGWGNALSGIVTDDPIYRDSLGPGQGQGFNINVESNPTGANKGWFSESSVQSLIYDLYDSADDDSDTISLGFTPIYQVMIGGEKDTLAFTSIFSFANQLKIVSAANSSAIDSLLSSQDIVANDDFGTGETNDGGDSNNLPIYRSLAVGGSIEVCSSSANGQGNKLGNRQFLTFEISTTGSYTITATGNSADMDPDFWVFRQGILIVNGAQTVSDESQTQTLQAGFYAIDAHDFNKFDDTPMAADTCLDVTLSAN